MSATRWRFSLPNGSKVEAALPNRAFRELRTLPGVMTRLDSEARRMAEDAGIGYVANPATETGGRGRGRASVAAVAYGARRDNAKNGTLSKIAARRAI